MPRIGRLHIPGGCYHVMGRGLERRCIFDGVDDKEDFLTRLGISLARIDARCLAWAVMSNHYHLLIKVDVQPLSKLMAPLLTGYAINYNFRHKRSGYVFQNRYQSILCDEDEYLLQLLRYIHLNPWKAGMVRDLTALDNYTFTGHSGLSGRHVQDWQSIECVLSLFSGDRKDAMTSYHQYIADGINSHENINFAGGGLIRSYGGWESLQNMRREHEVRIGDERISGKTEFVESILNADVLGVETQTENIRNGWDVALLIKAICQHYDVTENMLSVRGRMSNLSKARQLFAYLAITELGVSSMKVGCKLKIGQSGISKLVQKGREICIKENLDLSSLMGRR